MMRFISFGVIGLGEDIINIDDLMSIMLKFSFDIFVCNLPKTSKFSSLPNTLLADLLAINDLAKKIYDYMKSWKKL